MRERIKLELHEFGLLIKSVPPVALTLFVAALFSMNLLANKSISLSVDWLALDCGIAVSWFAFLVMDVLTKHFGPKAATEITVFATLINLALCLLFFLGSLIPGSWGAALESGNFAAANAALDGTVGGTWYVLLGSTAAFVASAAINNALNYCVGKLFKNKPDGAAAYFTRSYVSTAVAQFADNLIFAFIVSYFFFGWSIAQCFMCAATGMAVELLCEAAFSWFGYRLSKKWKRDGIGNAYFEYVASQKLGKRVNSACNDVTVGCGEVELSEGKSE